MGVAAWKGMKTKKTDTAQANMQRQLGRAGIATLGIMPYMGKSAEKANELFSGAYTMLSEELVFPDVDESDAGSDDEALVMTTAREKMMNGNFFG